MAIANRQLMFVNHEHLEESFGRTMNKAAPANEFKLDLHGAFLRRTDLSFASLKWANLTGADFTNAILRGADFESAILDGTVLKGADLTDARNLTRSQLARAILDETTKLPEGLSLSQVLATREQADR